MKISGELELNFVDNSIDGKTSLRVTFKRDTSNHLIFSCWVKGEELGMVKTNWEDERNYEKKVVRGTSFFMGFTEIDRYIAQLLPNYMNKNKRKRNTFGLGVI